MTEAHCTARLQGKDPTTGTGEATTRFTPCSACLFAPFHPVGKREARSTGPGRGLILSVFSPRYLSSSLGEAQDLAKPKLL